MRNRRVLLRTSGGRRHASMTQGEVYWQLINCNNAPTHYAVLTQTTILNFSYFRVSYLVHYTIDNITHLKTTMRVRIAHRPTPPAVRCASDTIRTRHSRCYMIVTVRPYRTVILFDKPYKHLAGSTRGENDIRNNRGKKKKKTTYRLCRDS